MLSLWGPVRLTLRAKRRVPLVPFAGSSSPQLSGTKVRPGLKSVFRSEVDVAGRPP